jgi:hypothetical protein
MEYMENTIKMHKETKRNMVLRKAKRAQKEKPTTKPNQGLAMWRKKSPNSNQTISNWCKTSQVRPIHS